MLKLGHSVNTFLTESERRNRGRRPEIIGLPAQLLDDEIKIVEVTDIEMRDDGQRIMVQVMLIDAALRRENVNMLDVVMIRDKVFVLGTDRSDRFVLFIDVELSNEKIVSTISAALGSSPILGVQRSMRRGTKEGDLN